MTEHAAAAARPNTPWTCPFCALLCDDQRAATPDCALARDGLAACAGGEASARLAGQPVDRATALRTAAQWLQASRQPLLGGWGCDVAGARALYPLACRLGAVSDAAGGAALSEALRAQQDRGGYTTTLAEVRSRADLIVFVGSWPAERAPRLFERLLADRTEPPALVLLGAAADAPPTLTVAGHTLAVEHLAPGADLAEAAALLNLALARPGAAAAQAWQGLAERLRAARYAVLVWEPAQLGAHAALLIERLQQLIGRLNQGGRAAGFPLGAGGGAVAAASAQAVHTWLSGLPLRTRVGPRGLEHDPLRHGSAQLLARGAVDALLWVAAFPGAAPPDTALPRIVLGPPGLARELGDESRTLFLPVATPGVHSAGHLFRTDNILLMPLHPADEGHSPTAGPPDRPALPALPDLPGVAATAEALLAELAALGPAALEAAP